MWLLFGSKKKLRSVPGGRRERRDCPSCGRTAEFVECEAESSLDVWFVDVLSDKQRVLVCTACEAQFTEEPAEEAPRPPRPRTVEHAPPARGEMGAAARAFGAQRAAPAPPPKRAAPSSREIDDRLAALKRKMGRD